jgi:16S rRNA (guanine966-N2)-methyltransferase
VPLNVIGGEFRGRRLKSPPGSVRPTAAIVRRSLFDILGAHLVDLRVLDLYAGAGTLGIEAISRGAASADFVERDRRVAAVLRANLEALGLMGADGRGRVHCAPVESWLESNRAELASVDIVLVDPPYGDAGLDRVLAALAAALRPGAEVVVEERASRRPAAPPPLRETRFVRHGDSAFTLMEVGA